MTILAQLAAKAQQAAAAAGPRGLRAYDVLMSRVPRGPTAHLKRADGRRTPAEHTVASERFLSDRASLDAIEERLARYPLYRAYFGLWGPHSDEVVLDYGCGPGDDVTGFALFSGARRVVGVDASVKALSLCAHRLSLHRIEPRRVELIQVVDGEPGIPIRDASVDYVHTVGKLHHTLEPVPILEELRRVLKPGGKAAVMVYNRDSVFFHLIVAYARMILDGEHSDLDIDDAFARMTGGPECPVSIAYRPGDWLEICRTAGFDAEFLGGYLSTTELDGLKTWRERALLDDRLSDEHRRFLRDLTFDEKNYPIHEEHVAGFGGSYLLRKPETD
jgi:SAM-dependent methyltransferase